MTQSKLTPSELLSRRSVLRGAALGAGVVAVPGLLAACSSGSSSARAAGPGQIHGALEGANDRREPCLSVGQR